MRKRIYQTVHIYSGNAPAVIYKYVMIAFILLSMIPLVTKSDYEIFAKFDLVCLIVFALDYFLRWITADYKFGKYHWTSFIKYPFRLMSIIDLMSVFALSSSICGWFGGYGAANALMVFRLVRILRYSKNVQTIMEILRRSKKPLSAVCGLAIGYIFISAIVLFNIEPDSFKTFFDAVYWSTVSLTTVGYGDIYPVTVLGRALAMISSFFGIAIVALPAGIITAEYIGRVDSDCEDACNRNQENKD